MITLRSAFIHLLLVGFMAFTLLVFSYQKEMSDKAHLVQTRNELNKALKAVKDGGLILIKAGTYTDFKLRITGKNVVVKAEKIGQVIFTGNSTVHISGQNNLLEGVVFKGKRKGGIVIIDGTKNRVTRCSFIDCNPPDPDSKFHWLEIDGTKNRVDHCFFEGMNHKGVQVVFSFKNGMPGYHTFDYNHLKNRAKGKGNGYETIRIGYSGYSHIEGKVTVEKNLFENCDGEAEIISIKTSSNIIRQNTFRNSIGTVTTRQCSGTVIENNYFLGNGKKRNVGGVRVIGPRQIIRNNYFEGLTRYTAIDLEAGNFKFILGKLYKNGAHVTTRNGVSGFIFPKSKSTDLLYNYGQVTEAKIEKNVIISGPGLPCLIFNTSYGSKERTLVNKNIKITENIFYSESRGSRLSSDKAPAKLASQGIHKPVYVDNIYYNLTEVENKVSGLKKFNPVFQRNEFGILKSKLFSEVGPNEPPLKPIDVGPNRSK